PATFARLTEDLTGLPVPGRVELRLVRDTTDLPRAAPPGGSAPPWADGVAWPDLGVMAVAGRRGSQPLDVQSTIDHELAHLTLRTALGGRAPRWLDEGFAYLHASEWSPGRTAALTALAWNGQPIGLTELERRFRGAEDEAARAYTQAYDLVAFLSRRGRYPDAADDGDRWPFPAFLAEPAPGPSLADST